MTDRFEQVRIFAAVADAGGFSRAGERLGLSRAAVSRNIIELEERLGVRLFNRTTRQVSLTEAGRDFLRQCQRILGELEEAERAASAASSGPQGQLRIVAPVNFGLRELGPAAAAFLTAYPNIAIDLSLNDRSIDPIEGGYDIAIRVASREPQLLSTLDMVTINRSKRILCAAPAYLIAHGVPRKPDDLARHQCLSYSYVDDPQTWSFACGDEQYRVRVRNRVTTSSSAVLASCAAAGLGVAYGPLAFFRDELAAGRLALVLDEYALPEVAVYALFARSRYVPPKVQAFTGFMADYLGARADETSRSIADFTRRPNKARPARHA